MKKTTTELIAQKFDTTMAWSKRTKEYANPEVVITFTHADNTSYSFTLTYEVIDSYNKDINDPNVEDARVIGWTLKLVQSTNHFSNDGTTLNITHKSLKEYAETRIMRWLSLQQDSRRTMLEAAKDLVKSLETYKTETLPKCEKVFTFSGKKASSENFDNLIHHLNLMIDGHKKLQEHFTLSAKYIEQKPMEIKVNLRIPGSFHVNSILPVSSSPDKWVNRTENVKVEFGQLLSDTGYIEIPVIATWDDKKMFWKILSVVPGADKDNPHMHQGENMIDTFIGTLGANYWEFVSCR